ncbi:MAG TPA: hypothetical protein VLE47_03780 [Candidatus Saccharimonadales bacterium]|nr:hypothetical protein [Candidatus Saccharimonadales bacterium]
MSLGEFWMNCQENRVVEVRAMAFFSKKPRKKKKGFKKDTVNTIMIKIGEYVEDNDLTQVTISLDYDYQTEMVTLRVSPTFLYVGKLTIEEHEEIRELIYSAA